MPNTERDGLGPGFESGLKDALDRITPPASPPRYLSATMGGARPWRLAPMVAIGATCLLALTATVATGSASPVVWTQRAASTLQSIAHQPVSTPSPAPETTAEPSGESPEPVRGGTAPTPSHEPEHESSPRPEPSEAPENSPSPRPSESPSPSGDHSESSPGPMPTSGDH